MLVLAVITAWTVLLGGSQPAEPVVATGPKVTVERPQCRSARLAVPHYRQLTWSWQTKRSFSWSEPSLAGKSPVVRGKSCVWARLAAHEWQARAKAARESYQKWWDYQYNWREWLPSRWYQIGSCETGYGGDPNWAHYNGEFEGAFGNRGHGRGSSWDAHVGQADPKAGPYPSSAALATPRQQYEHALVLFRLFGWDPWGCA